MRRAVTHWYTKDQPIFGNTEDLADNRIDVTRIPGGSDTPPCMKISHNTFETMEKANWEFLRLSLPVSCQSNFIDENEKARRWEEIKIRQHRLLAEVAEQTTPAHIDHIMKSGFTMNDIKGLHRNYSEDAVEADEIMRPSRPPRKGSLSRPNGFEMPTLEINGHMQRASSELDMNQYNEMDLDKMDDKKKRGRSPFRFFGKKRDQSKEKIKDSPPERVVKGRTQTNLMARAPTVRVSNVR